MIWYGKQNWLSGKYYNKISLVQRGHVPVVRVVAAIAVRLVLRTLGVAQALGLSRQPPLCYKCVASSDGRKILK